ncbi:molybdenum ABC transporter permease [Candidatus Poribacteria bacterium]|nr:MAG: molybdenum ABC transporter permease [Candidatus Poribacteria bacterium]
MRARRFSKNTAIGSSDRLFTLLTTGVLFLYLLVILALMLSDISYINFDTFRRVLWSREIRFAIKLSLITSVITTFLSLCVAVPAGYALSRYSFPGKMMVDTVVDIPIVLPPLIMGVSLLVFFQTPVGRAIERSGLRFVYTPQGIVLAQFVVACSFAIRTIKAAFDGVDRRLEDVAMTLGCNRRQAFLKVSLPLAKNGIIAGGVFAWARAIGEFGPIIVFCGTTRFKTEVMPTSIYLELSVGRIESALSIAILMILIALATLMLFKKLGGVGYIWIGR